MRLVESKDLQLSQDGVSFIKERLTEVRNELAMKKITLSKILNLSASTITMYENGSSSPPYSVIEQMCRVFNVPASYFYKPIELDRKSLILFRDSSKTTKTEKSYAVSYIHWLRETCDLLDNYVEMPKLNLPNFEIPDSPFHITDALIEEIASDLRKFWGLGQGPITNIVRTLETNGVIVAGVDVQIDGIDALMTHTENRVFIVYNRSQGSATRQRFSILHDFCHGILHGNLKPDLLEDKSFHNMVEKQAHRLASAILMPSLTFTRDIQKITLGGLKILKPKWKVSIAAMIRRLYDTGKIDHKQYTSLMMDMSKRGWRLQEPFDDVVAFEEPVLLSQALSVISQYNLTDKQQIVENLGFPKNVVAEICNVSSDYFDRESRLVTPIRQ